MTMLASPIEELRRFIGAESAPTVTEVEKGAIRKFALAIGDPNPLYSDEAYAKTTRFGGIIAPPTFVAYFKYHGIEPVDGVKVPLSRVLHTDDVVESYVPIRPGDVITTVARFTDVFEKQGKQGPMLFRTTERTLTNQRGEVAGKVRMTTVNY